MHLRLCGQIAKERGELLKGLRGHPTLNLLALARHLDKTGAMEFFQVMGEGGGRNINVCTKLADTVTHCILRTTAGAGWAATGEAAEHGQAMRIAQRLELSREGFDIISNVRHVSNNREAALTKSRYTRPITSPW
nr:hypothetical protein [Acidithiobacillus ferridurans]